jgi:hypothetical protein
METKLWGVHSLIGVEIIFSALVLGCIVSFSCSLRVTGNQDGISCILNLASYRTLVIRANHWKHLEMCEYCTANENSFLSHLNPKALE